MTDVETCDCRNEMYPGWSKHGEINMACILGLYRDNRTHCGGGYASVGTKNV